MKRKIFSVLLALVLALSFSLMTATPARAAARIASVSGNWSDTATWGGAAVPTSADTVTINSGIAVTVDMAAFASTVTFAAVTTSSNITISGTNSLTVTGLISMPYPSAGQNATIAVGAGSLSAGSLTMSATTVTTRPDIISISTGSATISGTVTTSGVASRFTFTDAGTLTFGGTVTLTGAPTLTTFPGSTVTYSGAAQTGIVGIYNNLTVAGSGAKTFATTPTVNGTLSMEGTATIVASTGVVTYGASATLQYNSTHTATTEEWLATFAASGGVIINAGNITMGAAKVFSATAPLTINSGATLIRATSLLTLNGDLINNGGTVTSTTGGVTITGTAATQSIGAFTITTTGTVSMTKASGTATFTGNVSGRGLTINGAAGILNLGTGLTHTFGGNWTRTAGTLNGGSSTVNFTGAGVVFSGTGGTFTPSTGTVIYSNAAAQTFPALTFNNLTLSGGGVKTVATTPTVNGILSMEGTATVVATSGVVTYNAGATLQYNTATPRTVTAEEWITPFAASGGVIIANTGTITLNAAKVFNASVPLTINSGATLATGNFQLTLGGNFVNNGGTFTGGSAPIVIADTMVTQSIAGFTTTGTVSMTKTAGTATFTGNVSGAGLTINGVGGTLNLGTGLTHTFSGTWTRTAGTLDGGSSTLNFSLAGVVFSGTGGTFTPSTGTVIYSNAAAQTFPALTYNNLTLSGGGVKTVATTPTVNGILSMEGTATVTVTTGVVTYGASATLQYNTATARTVATTEWITLFAASGGVIIANTGTITLDAAKVFNASVPLTINSGATLATGNFDLTLGGDLVADGTFTAGTSTVTYNGAAQTVAGVTYNNLTLSGSGIKTTTGVTVNGILSMAGTATASAAPTYGVSAVLEYAGSGSQTTGPELTATIPNLTINNASGVALASSPTISGTLTLTSGNITTGSNTVIISSSGSVSGGSSSSYVIGNLRKNVATGATSRTFEVGTANYNPVTVAFGSVSVAGDLTVKAITGEQPNIASATIDSTKDVNAYWTLTNSGITFDSYNATFTFAPGDIDGSANTSAFIVGRYNSGWTYPTVGTRTSTSTQVTGVTSLSDFAIGESMTWVSYNDAAHTVPDDLFNSSGNSIVYMYGQGFQVSYNYTVAYYDGSVNGSGQKVMSEGLISGASGNLSSQWLLTTDPNATAGTWHAVVFDGELLPIQGPPTNYNDAATTSGYVTEDSFEVTAEAIPEFPTVMAAIAVAGLCFVIYYWLRKRSLVYVRV